MPINRKIFRLGVTFSLGKYASVIVSSTYPVTTDNYPIMYLS